MNLTYLASGGMQPTDARLTIDDGTAELFVANSWSLPPAGNLMSIGRFAATLTDAQQRQVEQAVVRADLGSSRSPEPAVADSVVRTIRVERGGEQHQVAIGGHGDARLQDLEEALQGVMVELLEHPRQVVTIEVDASARGADVDLRIRLRSDGTEPVDVIVGDPAARLSVMLTTDLGEVFGSVELGAAEFASITGLDDVPDGRLTLPPGESFEIDVPGLELRPTDDRLLAVANVAFGVEIDGAPRPAALATSVDVAR